MSLCSSPLSEAIMPLLRQAGGCARFGLISAVLVTGCASTGKEAKLTARTLTPMEYSPVDVARVSADVLDRHVGPRDARTRPADSLRAKPADILRVDHTEMVDESPSGTTDGEELFAGEIALALPELLIEVERRNPSLQAAL